LDAIIRKEVHMNNFSALLIASQFINLASELDENDLTNLKLQKLLYFAQGKYLAQTSTRLFQEDIEAWKLGPVVKDVYHAFKSCGAFPITVFDMKTETKDLTPDALEFIKGIWSEYGKFAASYLVDLTHKTGTPWYESYKKGDTVIPDGKMIEYFSSETQR
jgi:uncharacterized phage-associated protein